MPSDTVYVTLLREPVVMFEAIFTNKNLQKQMNIQGDVPLNTFLKHPNIYYNTSKPSHAKNPMLTDLGLQEKYSDNEEKIATTIDQATKKFDLVMLHEHLYESLILLKELMCWTFEDIVYFTFNNFISLSMHAGITRETMELSMAWNAGDVQLYRHFTELFWKKVHLFGMENMQREVTKLKVLNEYYQERCLIGKNDKRQVGASEGVGMDFLKPEARNDIECVSMILSESEFTKRIRMTRMGKLPASSY